MAANGAPCAPLTWRGKPLGQLTDAEISSAIEFAEMAYEITRVDASPHVWGFFASARSELTIEQVRRMGR